ncbi:MAG: hypothetical protein ACRDYY_01345 [Acidimicrobiales bacterium]
MSHHSHPSEDLDPYDYDDLDPYPNQDPYPDLDPYSDRTAIPSTDAACRALLDQSVEFLIILRGGSTKDPGARLSVLASLAAEAAERIPDAVWSARVLHRYTWDLVAERLAITADAARKRYSHDTRTRSELAMHDHRCRAVNTNDCRPMCK